MLRWAERRSPASPPRRNSMRLPSLRFHLGERVQALLETETWTLIFASEICVNCDWRWRSIKKQNPKKHSLSGYTGVLGESLYEIRILFHPNEIKLTTVMSLWHNEVLSEVFASRLNKSAVMEHCGGTQMQINDLFVAKIKSFRCNYNLWFINLADKSPHYHCVCWRGPPIGSLSRRFQPGSEEKHPGKPGLRCNLHPCCDQHPPHLWLPVHPSVEGKAGRKQSI